MTLEDPGRSEVQRADQARVVWVMADRRQHLDLEVLVLQDDFGARDGEFAEPAIAKTAAYHDALRLLGLLGESFVSNAREGSITAAALAANVNIPAEYSPPVPDGLRVHLERADLSRFIYVPYRVTKRGLFKKKFEVEFFNPIPVETPPSIFTGALNA